MYSLKRVLSTLVLSKRVLPKHVRSTVVESCNRLRLEVATNYNLKLRMIEVATNYKT
jgi:hypothetical protein